MDINELNILEVIYKHEYISQREISNEVGISLGMVNLLLKKFLKVGIIKAERLNGNKVKYILTPDGIAFLSKKTIDFVSRSYQAVKKIQAHMIDVVKEHYREDEVVIMVGQEDEVGNLLYDILKHNGYTIDWRKESVETVKFLQWMDPKGEGIYVLHKI